MKKILLTVIMTCYCIGLVMAQEQPGGTNKPLRELGKGSLVYSDPAKSIEVTIGQEFAIELDANATTGYQWQLAKTLDNTIIKQLGTEYRLAETGLIGAGGKEVWKFKALGLGKTIIAMKYIRPWEKEVLPVGNVQFRIIVH